MNKLTAGQMTVSLLLSSAFTLMCFSYPIGVQGIPAVLAALLVQAVLCLPMLLLYRRKFSLAAYCQKQTKKHRTLPLLLVLYFVLRGGVSFVLLWRSSASLALPVTEPLLTAALIGVVCLYTASLGLRSFGRSAGVVFGFFLLTLGLLLLGAYPRIDLLELYPSPDTTVLQSTLRILSLSDTLPLLFVLLSFTDGKRFRSGMLFLLLQAMLWLLIFLLCMTVLGALLPEAEYPFFLLISVSQPLQAQRSDAVYLVVFVLLCVIRITLLTVLSAHLLGMLFPKLRLRSMLTLAGMILSALLFAAIGYTGNIFCLGSVFLIGTLLPLCLLLRIRRHPAWTEKGDAAA